MQLNYYSNMVPEWMLRPECAGQEPTSTIVKKGADIPEAE